MGEAAFSCFLRDGTVGAASFAHCLREARRTLYLKQTCLSSAIGCTEAAVSFWESGHRLPTRTNLRRLVDAMTAAGATMAEQRALWEAWFRDKANASQARAWRRSQNAHSPDQPMRPVIALPQLSAPGAGGDAAPPSTPGQHAS
jgi:hypothetical protein